MTENEAIKELMEQMETAKSMISCNMDFEPKRDNSVLENKIKTAEMTISSLEEIRKYRSIGTVEECQRAVEKQKAKNKGDFMIDKKKGASDKAVLLIDMPEYCKDCEFYYEFECAGKCRLHPEMVEKNKKSERCPLVPLPKKKERSIENWEYDVRASAWNSCIDSIISASNV